LRAKRCRFEALVHCNRLLFLLGEAIRACVRVTEGEAFALKNVAQWLGGMSVMSTHIPAALAGEADTIAVETRSTRWAWIEAALTALLTTVAVLAVSLFAVVTHL
jgi:hypothetical protein